MLCLRVVLPQRGIGSGKRMCKSRGGNGISVPFSRNLRANSHRERSKDYGEASKINPNELEGNHRSDNDYKILSDSQCTREDPTGENLSYDSRNDDKDANHQHKLDTVMGCLLIPTASH